MGKDALLLPPEVYRPVSDPLYHPAWRGVTPIDCNLVLEGGSMRGMFTAGVLDFLMDEEILPARVIGVSAGALNAYNYAAGMRGRVIYLSTKYCDNWHYYSLRSLLLKGSAFDVDYVYRRIMYELDPFDFDAFYDSPLRFTCITTSVETGEADYHELSDLRVEMDYIRASASIPLLAKTVYIDGKMLLDGGISDSVPIDYSMSLGTKKHIVVLTQDASFVKTSTNLMAFTVPLFRRYPDFIAAIKNRHIRYNQDYKRVAEMHEKGEVFLLRPQQPVTIANMERNKRKLYDLYLTGYGEAKRNLPALQAYLS